LLKRWNGEKKTWNGERIFIIGLNSSAGFKKNWKQDRVQKKRIKTIKLGLKISKSILAKQGIFDVIGTVKETWKGV